MIHTVACVSHKDNQDTSGWVDNRERSLNLHFRNFGNPIKEWFHMIEVLCVLFAHSSVSVDQLLRKCNFVHELSTEMAPLISVTSNLTE